MFLGSTQLVRGLFQAAVSFCCVLSLTVGPVAAQQLGGLVPATDSTAKTNANAKSAPETPKPAPANPTPESVKSEIEEMSATVRQLEERIRELESKLARLESAASQ